MILGHLLSFPLFAFVILVKNNKLNLTFYRFHKTLITRN